ncbi:hypothetical protein HK098_006545 [Nowakowskiella sp. JEL0407]|nr:hypothetical protein HK098_006545 [Nowakowskiella sp. JEL0407]
MANSPQRRPVPNVRKEKQSPWESTIESVQQHLAPYVAGVQIYSTTLFEFLRYGLEKYPALKTFLIALGGASAIPILTFLGFTGITLGSCLAIAGTIIAIIQGGIILFSSFVLFWFLLGAAIFAGFCAFWFSVAYFAVNLAKKVGDGNGGGVASAQFTPIAHREGLN